MTYMEPIIAKSQPTVRWECDEQGCSTSFQGAKDVVESFVERHIDEHSGPPAALSAAKEVAYEAAEIPMPDDGNDHEMA